jgi:TonB family protein
VERNSYEPSLLSIAGNPKGFTLRSPACGLSLTFRKKMKPILLLLSFCLASCSSVPRGSLPALRSDVLYFEDTPQGRRVAETVIDLFGDRQEVVVLRHKLPPKVEATPLTRVAPEFPDEFRQRHLHGEVVVQFIVDENGRVIEAATIRSAHPELARLAVEAVRKWTFRPAMRDGHPIRTVIQNPISFALK